jgi:hypothetical protein
MYDKSRAWVIVKSCKLFKFKVKFSRLQDATESSLRQISDPEDQENFQRH